MALSLLALPLIDAGTQFLKTGDCAIWDDACIDRQEREMQIRELEAQTASAYLLQSQQKDNTWIYVIAAVVVLLIIITAIYLANKSKSK